MNYTEAADRIKQIAFQYTGILELADALAEAGSLEATIAGRKKQNEEAQAALTALQAEKATLVVQIEEESAHAKAIEVDARRKAADVFEAAATDAAMLIQQAKLEAAQAARDERDTWAKALDAVSTAVKAAQAELLALKKQIADANAEQQKAADTLAGTQKAIDSIQARARKLLE